MPMELPSVPITEADLDPDRVDELVRWLHHTITIVVRDPVDSLHMVIALSAVGNAAIALQQEALASIIMAHATTAADKYLTQILPAATPADDGGAAA